MSGTSRTGVNCWPTAAQTAATGAPGWRPGRLLVPAVLLAVVRRVPGQDLVQLLAGEVVRLHPGRDRGHRLHQPEAGRGQVVALGEGGAARRVGQGGRDQVAVRDRQPQVHPRDGAGVGPGDKRPVQLFGTDLRIVQVLFQPLVPQQERQDEWKLQSAENRIGVRILSVFQDLFQHLVDDVQIRHLSVGVAGVQRDFFEIGAPLHQGGRVEVLLKELEQVGQVGGGRVNRPRVIALPEIQRAEELLVTWQRTVLAHGFPPVARPDRRRTALRLWLVVNPSQHKTAP